MLFIVGFLARRSGGWETSRSRFGRSDMRSAMRSNIGAIIAIGAISWFALRALYSQLTPA